MDIKNNLVGVLPAGKIPEIVLKSLAAHITGYLHLHVEILPPLETPLYAYDAIRHQYDAGIILKTFESMGFKNTNKVIGVVDVDLFVPIFTHVFGEARQNGKYALVSFSRLGTDQAGIDPSPALLLDRTAKVALHELGHLFNIFHCDDKNCLMHFSGDLEDLDKTPLEFCAYCTSCLKN